MLSEEAIAARREYKKKWAHNTPDKIRAQQERYWQRRAEQQAQEEPEAQAAQLAEDEQA